MNRDNPTFTNRLSRIEKDLFNFKALQLSGAGNVIGYITETANTWDVTITANGMGGFGYQRAGQIIFLFTADNKPAAFTTFEVDVTIDGIPYYKSAKGPFGSYDADIRATLQEVTNGDKNISKYQTGYQIVYGANAPSGTTVVRIKGRALSVDTGTLTVLHTVTS